MGVPLLLLIISATGFAAYSVGRVGHVFFGHWNTPHHWIYGMIAVIAGVLYPGQSWSIYAISIGVGLFISDLIDFLEMRFHGKDDHVKERKFWGFD